MTDEQKPELTLASISDRLPALPEGATFSPQKVEKVTLPHPFCITPKHVGFASDNRSGMLTTEAIKASGAPCGMKERGGGYCQLDVDEHETMVTLFVEVEDNRRDLNEHVGLGPWLQEVKDAELGLDGFAFPSRGKL